MAEDQSIYNVTFQKDASANSKELYQKYTASILETINIVEKNEGTIDVSFVIRRKPEPKPVPVKDDDGNIVKDKDGNVVTEIIDPNPEIPVGGWEFHFGSGVSESVLDTRERQWRSNNYLTNKTKYGTPDQCIEALKKRYQLDGDVRKLYNLDEDLSEETMLKVMAIYSEMQMNKGNEEDPRCDLRS